MNVYENSVRFAVLGPVRAWRGEQELDLGSPQQRVVLAALLLRHGHPVPLGGLIDAVWGAEPPAAAVSVLRTYVSRLRKVLEPDRNSAGPPRTVVSVGDGYVLRVPDDALDLVVFQQRVARAKKLRAAGDLSGAAELLHAALDGWQGDVLAGLNGPLAESARSWLGEEWLTVVETRLDLDIELGRHHEVIGPLITLSGRHPLREQLCRLLMLALYRSGRQAEALAAYRGARNVLVTELGIEPGASLQDLHDRILAADPALMPDPVPGTTPAPAPAPHRQVRPSGQAEPSVVSESSDAVPVDGTVDGGRATDEPESDGPADRQTDGSGHTDRFDRSDPNDPPPGVTRPAQLPPDLPTFAGRHAELDRTNALLPEDGGPPTTVVISAIGGMGGIGKSTLAVHWAHRIADRFPGGQLYINLRGFDPTGSAVTPDEAIRIFLDALGVPPMRIPAGLDAQVALYRSMLAQRRVLILLDNARDTEQVRPLLPGSPGCLVIVTSRNRLTGLVAGEGAHPLTLDQLTSAEAHDLLARRLGTDRLAAEPEAADEIIARCGRLPLALAIVAAHARAHPAFPLGAIADEVSDSHGSLDAFAGGDGISTDVRAVFSWSYKALPAPAARLFRLLGLHFGPDISAPAAAGLAGLPPREARGLLAELTRAHLLTEHFPGRYTLHDLLRVYAAERVRAEETPEERDLAVERLLAWYLYTADAAYPHITPNRRRIALEPLPEGCRPLEFATHEQALAWCETERPHLVAAVHQAAASGQPGTAWRLTAVLWGFFYLRSHIQDWLGTARTGLAAARDAGDREGEAQGLADMAAALRHSGRLDEAIECLHLALDLFRELGDREGRSVVIGNLGDSYLQAGRLAKAVEYSRRALALDRAVGSVWGEGIALCNLGDAYQRLGRYADALDCLEQALVVLRAGGNRWVEGVAFDILGTVHHRLGHYDEAVEYYHLALATHRDIGNRWGEGHTLGNLGEAHLDAEEPETARTSWRQAVEIFMELGHPDAEKVRARLARLQDGPADARTRRAAPKRTA
ncbi:AfsR/SARP family transcriptional regulator [Streptomyces sp. NPDC085927]|uniref:AfsR/SARP family transcriptional regulator n=1 Tax=Streptomyces sp. NPDC085927 TaxID=3365738 RepID=UPI0037D4C97D